MTSKISDCEANKMLFIDKLVDFLHQNDLSSVSKDEIRKNISNWLEKGIESEEINSLLKSPDMSKNFPIWWSGFWVEDPKPSNPIKSMKDTAFALNGYSSLDTELSKQALDEQNKMWDSCWNDKNFNFGRYLSETYTKLALINNPKNIGLFVNKDSEAFIKSYFFSTEIDLINEHYREKNMYVNLYILNVKDNCNDIIEKINSKVTNIDIICVNDCDPLSKCIKTINANKNRKFNPIKKAGKYKKSIKKSKKKKLKKKSKKKKSKSKSR